MKKHSSLLLVLFLALTHALFSQPQTGHLTTVSGKRISADHLDRFIQKAMDSLQLPGLSIAIINQAQLVYHRSFGVKKVGAPEKINENTLFEGASLSKPLFSYFVLKLADQGVIKLDTPLYRYLPHPSIKDNDPRYKLITARMVLSHTTGFPNWSVDQPVPIQFTPGTDFSYSGEAHQYLTALLAVRQGTNWQSGLDSIFQRVVAQTLGMRHSYYVRNDYTGQHKATGYHKDGTPKLNWLNGSISFGGAHTLHTEAGDYAQFLMAMMKGTGLQKTTYEDMLREQIQFPKDHELRALGQTGWCLGFAMKSMPYGMRFQHTGNNSGFQSYCCFYKKQQYGLVFFTNCEKAFDFYKLLGVYLEDEF